MKWMGLIYKIHDGVLFFFRLKRVTTTMGRDKYIVKFRREVELSLF